MLTIQPAQTGLAAICEPVLRALPEWFGIEAANQHYLAYVDSHPTFLALLDGNPAGFLALKEHFPQSAEIYVMAVRPEYHHQGVGRALVAAAEAQLRQNGTLFLQVKTLAPSHPDEGYKRTRLFYQGVGFVPLEQFDALWGPENPALQLVKFLG